jgi:hypothetical protein
MPAIPEAGRRSRMVGPLRTTGRWTVGTPARILRACVEGCHPAVAMAPDQEEQGPDTAIMDRALGCVLEVGHDPILVPVLRSDHRPWGPHTAGPPALFDGTRHDRRVRHACLRRSVPHGPVIKVFFSGEERFHPHWASHHPWKQAACMVKSWRDRRVIGVMPIESGRATVDQRQTWRSPSGVSLLPAPTLRDGPHRLGYPWERAFRLPLKPAAVLPILVGLVRAPHRDIARDRGLRPAVPGLQ